MKVHRLLVLLSVALLATGCSLSQASPPPSTGPQDQSSIVSPSATSSASGPKTPDSTPTSRSLPTHDDFVAFLQGAVAYLAGRGVPDLPEATVGGELQDLARARRIDLGYLKRSEGNPEAWVGSSQPGGPFLLWRRSGKAAYQTWPRGAGSGFSQYLANPVLTLRLVERDGTLEMGLMPSSLGSTADAWFVLARLMEGQWQEVWSPAQALKTGFWGSSHGGVDFVESGIDVFRLRGPIPQDVHASRVFDEFGVFLKQRFESEWRRQGNSYVRVSGHVLPTPLTALADFLERLQRGDWAGASGLAAEAGAVDAALRLGLDDGYDGAWLGESQEEHDGTARILFSSSTQHQRRFEAALVQQSSAWRVKGVQRVASASPPPAATEPPRLVQFTTVKGTAGLDDHNGRTTVIFRALGFEPNTSHGVMIRVGACAQPERQDFGDVVVDLPTLQADEKGRAAGTATIEIPISTLTDGNHKITLGMLAGRSRGADCGDIPAARPAPAPMPATPTPPTLPPRFGPDGLSITYGDVEPSLPHLANDVLHPGPGGLEWPLHVERFELRGAYNPLVLDPAGRFALYTAVRHSSHEVVWRSLSVTPTLRLLDLGTGRVTLFEDGAIDPAWGRHGRIAYVKGDPTSRVPGEPYLGQVMVGRVMVRTSVDGPATPWTKEPGEYRGLVWAGDRLLAGWAARSGEGQGYGPVVFDGPDAMRPLLPGAPGGTWLIALSPDGTRALVTSASVERDFTSTAYVIDIASGAELSRLKLDRDLPNLSGGGSWVGDRVVTVNFGSVTGGTLHPRAKLVVLNVADGGLRIEQVYGLPWIWQGVGPQDNSPRFLDPAQRHVGMWLYGQSSYLECDLDTKRCVESKPSPSAGLGPVAAFLENLSRPLGR